MSVGEPTSPTVERANAKVSILVEISHGKYLGKYLGIACSPMLHIGYCHMVIANVQACSAFHWSNFDIYPSALYIKYGFM